MNKIKKTAKPILISLLICIAVFPLYSYAAQLANPIGASDFSELLTDIADAIGTLIATLGGIMILVAGILYLTSAGNPEKIATAKKALIYAITGIVIGLAAGAIVDIIKENIGA